MSPDPTPTGWRELGPAVKARREALGMSRAQVRDAGGPSPATQQRIENAEIKTDIDTATKTGLERALQLPPGWINEQLGLPAPTITDGPAALVIEGEGERILVAITDGVSRLSIAERKAVLALVRGLHNASPD